MYVSVILSVSEISPGRVVFYGAYITVISSPQVLPFQAILRKFAQDDNVSLRDPLWVVAIPKIGVSPPVQATPPSNAGIASFHSQ